jgi:hypothetical protein
MPIAYPSGRLAYIMLEVEEGWVSREVGVKEREKLIILWSR